MHNIDKIASLSDTTKRHAIFAAYRAVSVRNVALITEACRLSRYASVWNLLKQQATGDMEILYQTNKRH